MFKNEFFFDYHQRKRNEVLNFEHLHENNWYEVFIVGNVYCNKYFNLNEFMTVLFIHRIHPAKTTKNTCKFWVIRKYVSKFYNGRL